MPDVETALGKILLGMSVLAAIIFRNFKVDWPKGQGIPKIVQEPLLRPEPQFKLVLTLEISGDTVAVASCSCRRERISVNLVNRLHLRRTILF